MYKRMYGVETFVVGNVAEALYLAKQSLDNVGELVKTRVGMAKEFKTPVAITYNHPQASDSSRCGLRVHPSASCKAD